MLPFTVNYCTWSCRVIEDGITDVLTLFYVQLLGNIASDGYWVTELCYVRLQLSVSVRIKEFLKIVFFFLAGSLVKIVYKVTSNYSEDIN